MERREQGCLYVLASPIGNLEDLSMRALRILKEARVIFAEDTRHTRKLLSHFTISTPCERYSDQFHPAKKSDILDYCRDGQSIVLVSDAGTPVISDPGWSLVDLAWKEGIRVVPIPGPCAPIVALSACGFPVSHFMFWGFLPRSRSRVRRTLEKIVEWDCGIFFESPHRLLQTLAGITHLQIEGLQVSVARELTKHFEEIVRGDPQQVEAHFRAHEVRGEFCIILYKGKKHG